MSNKYSFLLLYKAITLLFITVLSVSSLMADHTSDNPLPANAITPNVPEFSITYQNEALMCSPTELIKTKTHKDLVAYECKKEYPDYKIEIKQYEERGQAETDRLHKDIKNKIAKGIVYSVEIPLKDVDSPTRARIIAEHQLNNRPYGKYLRMLLPAKLYLSIRPQFANSGEDREIVLRNAGSKGGLFYYHQFNNDLELIFHYEAGVDWQSDNSFINRSDASDTNRRLSYFTLKYRDKSIILGKYWSAYYDIAAFTDQYMTFGGTASGAFSGGAHGTPSGTGRADEMLQIRTKNDTYNTTLQVQFKHDTLRDWGVDYSYTMAGSMIYKGWENIKLGAAISYGKFDEENSEMHLDGIDGNDWSSIIGVTYKKNNFNGHAVLSYTKNHTSDDQDIYFDSIGAELYMRYDIDDSFRIAGGGNWLASRDNDYEGEYSIKDVILSLQYTFGEKTFDDLVYLEVSLPNGNIANGDSQDPRIAIGLRYLLDY